MPLRRLLRLLSSTTTLVLAATAMSNDNVTMIDGYSSSSSSSSLAGESAESRRPNGPSTMNPRHRRRLPAAPSRPSHLPNIDYGTDRHPFDIHRRRRRRSPSSSSSFSSSMREPWRRLQSSEEDDGERGDVDSDTASSAVATSWKTTTLDPKTDATHEPIRIRFDVSDLMRQLNTALGVGDGEDHGAEYYTTTTATAAAIDRIAATKLYLLIYEILPMTTMSWADVVRVVPILGGIYPLDAKRGSGEEEDDFIPTTTTTTTTTANTKEGQQQQQQQQNNNIQQREKEEEEEEEEEDDPIHAMYCPDETTSGIAGGSGADLLIYATVNRHCDGAGFEDGGSPPNNNDYNGNGNIIGTLATALSCQRDQHDRPITGSIDFCLDGMDSSSEYFVTISDIQSLMAERDANGRGIVDNMVGIYTIATEEWDGWGYGGGGGGATTNRNNNERKQHRRQQQQQQQRLTTNREMVHYSVGVAMHEIGHVLGISSDSLAYFRHPITGQALTPRPFEISTVTCVNGDKIQYLGMPSSEVLQERVVSSATTNGGGDKLRYYEVVTPTVQRVVKNQFNCPTLLGARLENQQDGTDCFGSHWDERLYYTEIMGAVFSKSMNVLSPLTLAYIESSGWYRVNYESKYVQLSTFGHGAGCDFINGQCIDGSNGTVSETFTEMFCNSPTTIIDQRVDVETSGPQTCDPSHTQKTYCDLVNTDEMMGGAILDEPPMEYQYFADQPGLRPYTLLMADYCPVPHLEGHSCFEYDGRYGITNEMEAVGETYGPNSRCIETDGTRSYSLCLESVCNDELGVVQLYAGNELRTCEYDGQIFDNVYDNVSIKCPKAALICPSLFCPSNCSGRGKCIYASDGGPNGNAMKANGRLARCICDSDDDKTRGCYNTPMKLSPEYGITAKNPNKANKTLFLAIIGSLIGGLSIMFVTVRCYKSKQNVFM